MKNSIKPLVPMFKKFGKKPSDQGVMRPSTRMRDPEIVQIGRFLRNMDEVFMGHRAA